MNIKILIILTIFLAPSVFALEQDVFQLVLKYDKGIITKESLKITKGYFTEVLRQPEDGYRLEVISTTNEVLYTQKFKFPLEVFYAPNPEWFDENGRQIFFPKEERKLLDTAKVELVFSYFSDAEIINIYDPNDVKVLEINVEEEVKIKEGAVEQLKISINWVFIATLIIIFIVLIGLFIQVSRLGTEKRREIMNIEEYIINNLKRGYSASQIRNELFRAGWDKKEIDNAMKFAMKRKK